MAELTPLTSDFCCQGKKEMAGLIMKVHTSNFLGYVEAVFFESWRKISTLFDIIGLTIFLFPQLAAIVDENVAKAIGITIFLVSFVLANYTVYKDLCVDGADIRMIVRDQFFHPSSIGRSPFRDITMGQNGFNEQGLPYYATLFATLVFNNVGFEDGRFILEEGGTKLKFPPLFDTTKRNFEFNPPTTISARHPSGTDFFFDIQFAIRDPLKFAQELKGLYFGKNRYQIIIHYHTQRVDGRTRTRKAIIEGDFRLFYDEVTKYWEDQKYTNLLKVVGKDV